MNVKNRIKDFIKTENLTIIEFEKSLNVANGYVNSISKSMGIDKMATIIEKYPNLNMDWLITGNGEMLKQKKPYIEAKSDISNLNEPEMSVYKLKTDYFGVERQQIPLYEIEASAGLNTLFSSQNIQIPLDYISVPNAPKCDGAISVRGDSMYPLLKAGDIICYKTILNINNLVYGEMYLLDIDNGDDQYLTVKYIQKSDIGDDFVKLVSENRYHAAKEEPKRNIRALAIIKLSIRYNTIS